MLSGRLVQLDRYRLILITKAVRDRQRVGTLTNINDRSRAIDRYTHAQSCDNLAGN